MDSENRRQEARDAGRGALFLTGAKAYFMLAGAVIEFALPAVLDAATFGAYAVVASTVSPINNVMVTGTVQAVSRFVAQARDRARAFALAGLRMHLLIGLPVALAFAATAPLSARFFHDPGKAGPLALAALIVAGYSLYAVFVGMANGLRWFHKQAGLDVTMATLRALGIVGLAAAGLGLYGAIGGWVAAVAVILVVAAAVVGLPVGGGYEPARPLARFFAGVAVYLVILNLTMFADQLLLKRLSAEWFLAAGLDAQAAATGADEQVGYYRAVQNLARLTYQAIIAATFVIFPLMSRASFDGDRDSARRYVRATNRYVLLVAGAIATVLAANPDGLLRIPYPDAYADAGALALAVLAPGNVFFSILAVAGAVLNGAGRTRGAIFVAGLALALAIGLNWLVLPHVEPGAEALVACAAATTVAMACGALASGWVLYREVGGVVPPASVLRVAAAAAVAVAAGRWVELSGTVGTLLEAAGTGVVFLLILVISREIGGRDLRALRGLVGRAD